MSAPHIFSGAADLYAWRERAIRPRELRHPRIGMWFGPEDNIDGQERCAVCGGRGALVVDHCHMSGLVRGLLCSSCNTAEAYGSATWWNLWRVDAPGLAKGEREVYYSGRGRAIHSRAVDRDWVERGDLSVVYTAPLSAIAYLDAASDYKRASA